jgi:hypothetical protein
VTVSGNSFNSIISAGAYLYVANYHEIIRVTKSTGDTAVIIDGLSGINGLTTFNGHLYASSSDLGGSGGIYEIS